MSLKLIIGSAGSGKTKALLGEIIAEAQRCPDKNFIVIVPEQVTMQTQDRLTAMHPGGTILNIDVLSFQRLAYRVFAELGLKKKELLDETGKTFIIQKIALDLADDLPYLGRRMRAPGSAAAMKSVISELMQYGVGVRDVRSAAAEAPDRILQAKLKDMAVLYEAYQERLAERFMTAEEVPELLSEVADDSALLRGSVLAFDGFTGFTPVQEKLVEKLIAQAERTLVTVTFDERIDPTRDLGNEHLFSLSFGMIRKLWQMAARQNAAVEPTVRMAADGAGPAELAFLKRHLFRPENAAYCGGTAAIALTLCQNPAGEAEGCAHKIASLVRQNGWRYRDIAVVCGDLAAYAPSIRRAFFEQNIPCFIDLKRPLTGNPFVEYLRAAVDACIDGYSYDSVFRCLKSGMSGLTSDEIDRLENYVLAQGIRSKRAWRNEWIWQTRSGEDEEELAALNQSRVRVCELLDPLSDELARRGNTVRSRTAALYRFAAASRCQEKLIGRKEAFERAGRNDLAREYAQIYGKVMALFDRFVDLLGNETMPMADYKALIEAGLGEIRIGLVPPGTDQVTVGDIERSRLGHIKALFFLGVNEGAVPKANNTGNLLTEADRIRLLEGGLALRPTPREEAYIQNFYLYLTLTKPTDRLFISLTLTDSQGGAARPSSLIAMIRRLYPDLEVEKDIPLTPVTAETPAEGLRILTGGVRDLKDRVPDTAWFELFRWFRRTETEQRRVRALLKGASFNPDSDVISREVTRKLYGGRIRGSATRLEAFAACPFSHFAAHGLKLGERDVFEYTSLDRGVVIHDALERFGNMMLRDGADWAALSDEECFTYADRCLQAAAARFRIFTDSARNAYELSRLQRSMRRAALVIRQQLEAGDFRPGVLEAGFADDLQSSSRIRLSDGTEMILRGQIDRIDVCDEGEIRYVKVIDYKTGTKTFDLNEVYHGLQLQLVLYMNAALEMAAEDGRYAVPAGLFYHPVRDPMLSYDKVKNTTPEEAVFKDLKESGFVSLESAVYRHLDRNLDETGKSDVIPLGFKKDGGMTAASSAGDQAAFRTLSRFAERKAKQIGEAILAGEARPLPYVYGKKKSCTYCPFKSVCGFDESLPWCHYRRIEALKNDEIIQRMSDELDN